MSRAASTPVPGEGTGHEAGPVSVAEYRLPEVGIRLRLLAAVCGISAECVMHVGLGSFPLSAVDGSPVRVAEAHLRLQDPDDAAFLAEVLWLPPVPRRSAADDWTWRGWLVGEALRDPLLSVTLSSASGGMTRQSRFLGEA